MRGVMECEGNPFVGHTHGIVLKVGGKIDVDEVVGEVVEKVDIGEDPVGEDDIG